MPIPEPGPGEVLVRIKACGFCQTDFKAITGARRNVTFPLIPGHEPAGVVAAVGAHATGVKILPYGPDLVIEAAGPIQAVRLMVSLLRRGTRWNVFGITTHESFELDGGLMHFLEARMDASFGTTPLAMEKAIRLMERGLVDPEQVLSHRFPLTEIAQALVVMASPERNKVVIVP